MKNAIFSVLTAILAVAGISCGQQNEYEKQWGAEISAFEQFDAKNSFPDNPVLFVGSSSIRMWETARFFPELKVINRGFGGSKTRDVNYFFNKIVLKYSPKTIVFYAGDNDIAVGYSPETVLADFKKFYDMCVARLANTNIIYISIKPSTARIKFWPDMKKTNELIEIFCKDKKNIRYLDLASCLLNSTGLPLDEYFKDDKLHLSEAGYTLWTAKLKPLLVSDE